MTRNASAQETRVVHRYTSTQFVHENKNILIPPLSLKIWYKGQVTKVIVSMGIQKTKNGIIRTFLAWNRVLYDVIVAY